MIKFFQKLKAKKGFTLVELIVVIAIIGVLAAILIPTMLGYVTSSRVTSANSTAASIKNNIDNWLTDCDTHDYGMLKSDTAKSTINIVNDDGTWTVSNNTAGAFRNHGKMTWTAGGTGKTKGTSKVGIDDPCELLAIILADLFPDMTGGSIVAYLEGGKCMAVAYTADTSAVLATTEFPPISANGGGWDKDVWDWDKHTAGVSPAGYIVGTAPAVPIG